MKNKDFIIENEKKFYLMIKVKPVKAPVIRNKVKIRIKERRCV
jgi:hypothetical protein